MVKLARPDCFRPILASLALSMAFVNPGAARQTGASANGDCVAQRPIGGMLSFERATIAITGADGRPVALGHAPGRIRWLARAERERLLAVVTDSAKQAVSLYTLDAGKLRYLGGGVEPARMPRRVALGDVDGDGRIEALVLVTGSARFDRRVALRPFVYGWDGARLYPKWLGSRLSRPFADATLGDLDRDARAELVAVEATRDGRQELAAYRWRGFGFERIATGQTFDRLAALDVDARGRIVVDVDGARSEFVLDDGRLVESNDTRDATLQPSPTPKLPWERP